MNKLLAFMIWFGGMAIATEIWDGEKWVPYTDERQLVDNMQHIKDLQRTIEKQAGWIQTLEFALEDAKNIVPVPPPDPDPPPVIEDPVDITPYVEEIQALKAELIVGSARIDLLESLLRDIANWAGPRTWHGWVQRDYQLEERVKEVLGG